MADVRDINNLYLAKFDAFLEEMRSFRTALVLSRDTATSISIYSGLTSDLEYMKTDLTRARNALQVIDESNKFKTVDSDAPDTQ